MVGQSKCPVCGKFFEQQKIVCPDCFGILDSLPGIDKNALAEIIENHPGLGEKIKSVLDMKPEEMLETMAKMEVKEFLDSEDAKELYKKWNGFFQGVRDLIDSPDSFDDKVFLLIKTIDSKKKASRLYKNYLVGIRRSDIRKKIKVLEQLALIFPYDQELWNRLIDCYIQRGRYKVATIFLSNHLRRFRQDWTKWRLLGMMYLEMDEIYKAIGCFDVVKKLNPTEYTHYYVLADFYESRDRLKEAIDALENTFRYDPGNQEALKQMYRLKQNLQKSRLEP